VLLNKVGVLLNKVGVLRNRGLVMDLVISPKRIALRGDVRVDGDKSISHRAALFGALAEGVTEVHGFLTGEDTRHTAHIMAAMGAQITEAAPARLTVRGVGKAGLRAPAHALDCGNSGTGMRLLAGVLAGQRFASTLTGDASLNVRPMRRVMAPLKLMGADISGTERDTAPLLIRPVTQLRAIDYATPVASAQVKSCVLLAGLYAQGITTVREPEPTRDHTERMLAAFGAQLTRDGLAASIAGGVQLVGQTVHVPADPSSAAFFAVAAAISPGSNVLLRDVCINPRRTGIFATLADMGAEVSFENQRTMGAEPVADIRVRGGALRGVQVPKERVADMIDEFPIFFIAASAATGVSEVIGAQELRVKESDRIGAMVRGLASLGVHAQERDDGVRIEGAGAQLGESRKQGREPCVIDSRGDHRIAMSFVIASLCANVPIKVLDCANIATSFPGFIALCQQLGLDVCV
jgi:3-phosphoshikimate 1-carboxyvinyltransferase